MLFRSVPICLLAALAIVGCANTPAPAPNISTPEPIAAPTAPASTEAQVIATVEIEYSVFFEPGASEVDEAGIALLRRHAERLKADPKQRLTLVGHTENLGSRTYSVAVAEKRVNVVYSLLRKFGVPQRQLRRYQAGAEQNSKSCQSPECRRLMRRVELKYAKAR